MEGYSGEGGGDMAYFQKIQNDRLLTKSELTESLTTLVKGLFY